MLTLSKFSFKPCSIQSRARSLAKVSGMTALAGMKLTSTLLADLPGNKMASPGAPKQAFQYRKCLQIKVRRTAPSEHFLKASDKESNSDDSSSSEDEEELSTTRTTSNPYRVTDSMNSFKPFKMTMPSITKTTNKNAIQTTEDPNSSDDSSSSETSEEETDVEIARKPPIPNTVRYHAWSESRERRLLDHLIDYDEEEETRINGIQTDDDFYLIWKCGGDSRRTSKNGADLVANKRAKTSKLSSRTKNQSFNQQIKRDAKLDVFCGWETIYSKKPIQKLKEERKQRLSQPNTNLYASKYAPTSDRSSDTSPPYTFFHYTDIARYIQQYRVNHTCENPCSNCSNYPTCKF